MWFWEREAYARGIEEGRASAAGQLGERQREIRAQERAECADLVKTADAAREAERVRLSQLLWEARREIPDDSPMHDRIRKALDNSGAIQDAKLRRIAETFPGSVRPLVK